MSYEDLKKICKELFHEPGKTFGYLIILLIIVIASTWITTFVGRKAEQAAESKEQTIQSSFPNEISLFFEEIKVLEKQAMWNYEDGGDRRSYQRLLNLLNTVTDSVKKDLIITAIDRVENSYAPNVMELNFDRLGYICKPNAIPDCSNGYEEPTGFLAGNVLDHLAPEKLWYERARAASLLRNIRTATGKNNINKEVLYEKLINAMKEDKENVLGVSKLAFESYKALTGFPSNKVFDFNGAINDWNQRKEQILKINFFVY